MRYGLSVSFVLLCAFAAKAGETDVKLWPLWDGVESVADYAQRVNLSPTQTLDLGNGVKLETVLIPAGKFIMGTPKSEPVDEYGFRQKIVTGQAFLAAGGGVLLVMLCVIVIRAIRLRRRPQYSLARFIVMILMLSEDWYCDYPANEITDPQGPVRPAKDVYRVLRGGNWRIIPWYCRTVARNGDGPGNRHDFIGFRVVVPVAGTP